MLIAHREDLEMRNFTQCIKKSGFPKPSWVKEKLCVNIALKYMKQTDISKSRRKQSCHSGCKFNTLVSVIDEINKRKLIEYRT